MAGAPAEHAPIGDSRGLQWLQRARLVAFRVVVGHAGMALVLIQYAAAREQLHQLRDADLQDCQQLRVDRSCGLDVHRLTVIAWPATRFTAVFVADRFDFTPG